MNRRRFIKNTAALLTTSALLKMPYISRGMPHITAENAMLLEKIPFENERILVIINLAGGNDGLNTIIPLNYYDNLAKLRPKIIIPERDILKASDTLGFHPSTKGLHALFNENKLSIIQNVGYPNQNRSHFRSADIWNSGSPANEIWSSGWLGRYLQKIYPEYPDGYPNQNHPDPIAIAIGNAVSETCQGEHTNFSFALDDPMKLINLDDANAVYPISKDTGAELNFIQNTIRQSNAYTKVITSAIKQTKSKTQYPENNKVAEHLQIVSGLISGGLKTKIYVLTLDGFDTHANQVTEDDSRKGIHADKLKILSDAIFFFQSDLKLMNMENRVIGITTSEFGRQIKANSSYGTDHGSAAPLFLFGSSVKKSVVGENPKIATEVSEQEGVAMQIDFRDIYGSVLIDWFGVSENDVKKLLHENFKYMALLNS